MRSGVYYNDNTGQELSPSGVEGHENDPFFITNNINVLLVLVQALYQLVKGLY